MKALIDPRSGRVCELREEKFAVADPLFWLDVGAEVTTQYSYDGANLVPPPPPLLEEVRAQAVERVEHGAEVELQAALGAKLPASVLLFQALSDELVRFQTDQAPTAETYPLLASLVGKRGAVDLQRAAQLVAERRARWLQRRRRRGAPARDPGGSRGRPEPGGDRRRAEGPRLGSGSAPAGRDDRRLTQNFTLRELAGSYTAERLGIHNPPSERVVERLPRQEELRVDVVGS